MRIALGIEYDGALFYGWQKQLGVKTLQKSLESALSKIAQEEIDVVAAGRTDTGVHALMQIVHFDTRAGRRINSWVRGVNSHLPVGMIVKFAQIVPDEFHARFDATSRSYRYILSSAAVKPAILSGKIGWTHLALDLNRMQKAAQSLIGEHDFSSFRSSECQAKSPVKTLQNISICLDGGFFCFNFQGSGFLHHMVRNIVGALVYVGSERMSIEDLGSLLLARDRCMAPPTFMPDGLYLTGVTYPEHFGLNELIKTDHWLWGDQ